MCAHVTDQLEKAHQKTFVEITTACNIYQEAFKNRKIYRGKFIPMIAFTTVWFTAFMANVLMPETQQSIIVEFHLVSTSCTSFFSCLPFSFCISFNLSLAQTLFLKKVTKFLYLLRSSTRTVSLLFAFWTIRFNACARQR